MGFLTNLRMRPLFESDGEIHTRIFEAISILDKYNKYSKELTKGVIASINNGEFYAFKSVREDTFVIDMFYKNLHVHIKDTSTESIVSIRMKRTEDVWNFNEDFTNTEIDPSHPFNETLEVFIWYRLPILDLRDTDGSCHTNGAWDSVLYKETEELLNLITGFTKKARFELSYKNASKGENKN